MAMRFRWDDIDVDTRESLMRDPTWLGDDVLFFSDEIISWLDEFAPDAMVIEMNDKRPFRHTLMRVLTEADWKRQHADDLFLEFDDDIGFLFKLTWL